MRSHPPCHERCLIAQAGARRLGPVGLNRGPAIAMGILALAGAAGKRFRAGGVGRRGQPDGVSGVGRGVADPDRDQMRRGRMTVEGRAHEVSQMGAERADYGAGGRIALRCRRPLLADGTAVDVDAGETEHQSVHRLDRAGSRWGGVGHEVAAARELGAAGAVGEEAEVADADEAVGDDVEEEADELRRLQRHHLHTIAVGVVLPAKAHEAIGTTRSRSTNDWRSSSTTMSSPRSSNTSRSASAPWSSLYFSSASVIGASQRIWILVSPILSSSKPSSSW